MASTFTFGFTGDDIDADADADAGDLDGEMQVDSFNDRRHEGGRPNFQPPRRHTLDETLSTLPSSISYNTLSIPLSSSRPLVRSSAPLNRGATTCQNQAPHSISIRRRCIFDILLQLKAEADIQPSECSGSGSRIHHTMVDTNAKSSRSVSTEIDHNDHDDLISSLEGYGDGDDGGGSDLRPGIYEGGFKTWECGVDLASYLASCLTSCTHGDGDENGDRGSGNGLARFVHRLNRNDDGQEEEEEEEEEIEDLDIVELGAGSAMPSLVLLKRVLELSREQRVGRTADVDRHTEDEEKEGDKDLKRKQRRGRIRFLLCDYNVEVLRLLTAANVLLQLVAPAPTTKDNSVNNSNHNDDGERMEVPIHGGQDQDQNQEIHNDSTISPEGELDTINHDHDHPNQHQQNTLSTLLHSASLSIEFISGAWGPSFVDLLTTTAAAAAVPDISRSRSAAAEAEEEQNPAQERKERKRSSSSRLLLILASETIYSPDSIVPFTETLMALLSSSSSSSSRRRKGTRGGAGGAGSTALVAAKKMYFGVGGGVDGFVVEVRRRGGAVDVLEEIGDNGQTGGGGGGGVGRVILQVSVAKPDSWTEG